MNVKIELKLQEYSVQSIPYIHTYSIQSHTPISFTSYFLCAAYSTGASLLPPILPIFGSLTLFVFRGARCHRHPDESGSIRRVNEAVLMGMGEPQKSLNPIPSLGTGEETGLTGISLITINY